MRYLAKLISKDMNSKEDNNSKCSISSKNLDNLRQNSRIKEEESMVLAKVVMELIKIRNAQYSDL